MIILVDSDVLMEVLRGRDAGIVARWRELAASEHTILCSVVSVVEIEHGLRAKKAPAVEALFRALPCVPVDQAVARQAGVFLRQYRKSHGVELGDALIAASARMHDARLWTRNRKCYPMIGGMFYE